VVIDETAGFLVTMFAIPLTVSTVAAGFFLFRLFDVIKIQPARALERQPGGFGIVADDLVCGLYANLVLQLGLRLLPAGAA
jgi:phosphatidylglycerophosphatase A